MRKEMQQPGVDADALLKKTLHNELNSSAKSHCD